jgi:hypothetical protein
LLISAVLSVSTTTISASSVSLRARSTGARTSTREAKILELAGVGANVFRGAQVKMRTSIAWSLPSVPLIPVDAI